MFGQRPIYESCFRPTGCAMIVLASFLLANGGAANADWPSLSSSRKQKPAAPTSKSTASYSVKIRQLMIEAETYEKEGDLRQAVQYAERAAALSRSTARLVATEEDVSPAATARYAEALRQKRADRSYNSTIQKSRQPDIVEQSTGRSRSSNPNSISSPLPRTPAMDARDSQDDVYSEVSDLPPMISGDIVPRPLDASGRPMEAAIPMEPTRQIEPTRPREPIPTTNPAAVQNRRLPTIVTRPPNILPKTDQTAPEISSDETDSATATAESDLNSRSTLVRPMREPRPSPLTVKTNSGARSNTNDVVRDPQPSVSPRESEVVDGPSVSESRQPEPSATYDEPILHRRHSPKTMPANEPAISSADSDAIFDEDLPGIASLSEPPVEPDVESNVDEPIAAVETPTAEAAPIDPPAVPNSSSPDSSSVPSLSEPEPTPVPSSPEVSGSPAKQYKQDFKEEFKEEDLFPADKSPVTETNEPERKEIEPERKEMVGHPMRIKIRQRYIVGDDRNVKLPTNLDLPEDSPSQITTNDPPAPPPKPVVLRFRKRQIPSTADSLISNNARNRLDDLDPEPSKPIDPPQADPVPATTSLSADRKKDLDELPDVTTYPSSELIVDRFPTENVLELKRRLQSAAALKPGEVLQPAAAEATDEPQSARTDEQNEPQTRTFRLRKRFSEFHESEPEAAPVANAPRNAIVGTTSLIRWRSAKDEDVFATPGEDVQLKSKSFPADIRQAFADPSERFSELSEASTPFALPTVTLGITAAAQEIAGNGVSDAINVIALPPLQGSLWEHAPVPPADEDFRRSLSDRFSVVAAGQSELAPLPPTESSTPLVTLHPPEYYPEDSAKRTANGTLLSSSMSDVRIESTIPNLASTAFAGVDDANDSPDSGATSDSDGSAIGSPLSGPIDRLASALGVPASSLASTLSAVLVVSILAGLWIVRGIVRSRNS